MFTQTHNRNKIISDALQTTLSMVLFTSGKGITQLQGPNWYTLAILVRKQSAHKRGFHLVCVIPSPIY